MPSPSSHGCPRFRLLFPQSSQPRTTANCFATRPHLATISTKSWMFPGCSVDMRNVFDQYMQPENRLTHALATALDRDRSLLAPFLRWLCIPEVPPAKQLEIAQQRVPGQLQTDSDIGEEKKGLPDIAVFNNDGWAVLIESKVQAHVSLDQLMRHRNTAQRHGFENPWLVVISVEEQSDKSFGRTVFRTWRDVYAWLCDAASASPWAKEMQNYMQVFERKMVADEYAIRGTITVFDGFKFDEENPYNYYEGKRLILLLGDLLQGSKELEKALDIDPKGSRRPAITGKLGDLVWDFLPLKGGKGRPFTQFPHLTMAIHRSHAIAAITIPNGIAGGFKSRLSALGVNGFQGLIACLEKRVRPILKRSEEAKPMIYVSQRHFKSQRSRGETDAELNVDLRTTVEGGSGKIRYQPEWIDAIFNVLTQKRSNVQVGVEIRFRYSCPVVRSSNVANLFIDSWKAFAPLVEFAQASTANA